MVTMTYMAGEAGLEPATPGFGDRCSNQIELHSYARAFLARTTVPTQGRRRSVVPSRRLTVPIDPIAGAGAALLRVFQTKGFGGFVIGEEFSIAAPVHHALQGPAGVFVRHIVLELFQETHLAGGMGGTLVEHEFYPRGKGQIGEEMIAEELFAHIDIRLGETKSSGRQFNIAFLDLGEAKQ